MCRIASLFLLQML